MKLEKKAYTLKEVAEVISVTRRSLYTYVKQGKLKHVRVGRGYLVTAESLNEFLAVGVPIKKSSINKNDKKKSSSPINTNSGLDL